MIRMKNKFSINQSEFLNEHDVKQLEKYFEKSNCNILKNRILKIKFIYNNFCQSSSDENV